ncbi:hypothetical protein P43SY_006108 [Pythium insidiosum]|uniref:GRIP domain-containing protein n=1 Tax=Pythium insidiosum TaxID=114742 RepID=A0AAD5LEC6_PYTIN|nr:hypothetical protein P43SY_006108 [Pythium insidiosum]
MNKEKLEQMMKKEKIEQMKELGRDKLSKGLSFLRQHANSAAHSSSQTQSLPSGSGDGGEEEGEEERAAPPPSSSSSTSSSGGAPRMTYDDLVSLSMKLTRQNKLMKAQFQKMQAQVAALEARSADADVLTAFVTHVVGVDVVACQRAPCDDASNDSTPTLDAKELRERFEIVDALKTKALRQEIDRLQAMATSSGQVENLLPMSPSAVPSADANGAQPPTGKYEEIDLLSDPLPLPSVGAAPRVDRLQLEQAMQQVMRLEENMKQSALENEDLQRKFDDLWQQRSSQLDEMTAERDALRAQVDALTGKAAEQEASSRAQAHALEQRIAELQLKLETTTQQEPTAAECKAEDAAQDTIKRVEQERDELLAAKEAVEEEVEVLRRDNSSNLESVVFELAECKKQAAEQREYMNNKVTALVKELDEARKECSSLTDSLSEKEKQHQKMVTSQTALTGEVMELQRQIASMREDLHMAAEGLEAHAVRAEEAELRRQEIEEKMRNTKLQMDTLREQHTSDMRELERTKDEELERMQREKSVLTTSLQDTEAVVETMSTQLRSVQAELETEKRRNQSLETRVAKLTAEVGNMSIDLAETKKSLSDRMALATRLQTENMGYAEKLAESAARVEQALRDAAASREAQAAMSREVESAMAQLSLKERERADAVQAMESLRAEVEEEKGRLASELEQQAAQSKAAIDAEKDAFRRELDRIEAESKQKSKLALHAVLEKEAEIERLSKRLAELEEDVRSGEADNRKIFEFAQLQANREMESRAKEARIQELEESVRTAEARIQSLLDERARHSEEVAELMQSQRREGVNLEYLKNVIVQYMTFKPGSSQQLRLVPVITTLLEFTPNDMKEVKKANASRRTSWGGSWGSEHTEYKPLRIGIVSKC